MIRFGVFLFLLFSQYATAELQSIACQYGEATTESFSVVEINGDQVGYHALDDSYGLQDFFGELKKTAIEDGIVNITARQRGRDAYRFLTISADLANHRINIVQQEILEVSMTMECRAIHLFFQ